MSLKPADAKSSNGPALYYAALLGLLRRPAYGDSGISRQELRFAEGQSRTSFASFRKVGEVWSVRVVLHYRALANERKEGLVWFWIGPHAEYDRLLAS